MSQNRQHLTAGHSSVRDIHASLKRTTTVYILSRRGTPAALRAHRGHGYAVGRQRRLPARSEIERVKAASEEGLCGEPSPDTELPSRRIRTRACPNSALGGRRSRVTRLRYLKVAEVG